LQNIVDRREARALKRKNSEHEFIPKRKGCTKSARISKPTERKSEKIKWSVQNRMKRKIYAILKGKRKGSLRTPMTEV